MPEYLILTRIEELKEGGYLAKSDDLQGLIAHGRTIVETIEIAQDVARKLIESYHDSGIIVANDVTQDCTAKHF